MKMNLTKILVAFAFISVLARHPLHAQATYFWDPSDTGLGTPTDGNGTWSTNSFSWSDGTNQTTYPVDGTLDTAVFGGSYTTTNASFTVGIQGTVSAGAIDFNAGAHSPSYFIGNGGANEGIAGPSGGTLQFNFANAGGWLANNLNGVNLTGATTYQFDSQVSGSGMKILGNTTFDGGTGATLVLGNAANNNTTGVKPTGADQAQVEFASVGPGDGNTLVINNGWTAMMDAPSATVKTAITLNNFGLNGANNWGGALEAFQGVKLTGTITLNIDSSIGGFFTGGSLGGNIAGQITGNHNLFLFGNGDGTAPKANNSSLTISGTNNNYTGATIIFNNVRNVTVTNPGNEAIMLGANNTLPTGTTLVLGITNGSSPIAGALAPTTSSANGSTALDGALDMHGFNQQVAGLATGTANAAHEYIANAMVGTTSTLTVNGTGTPTSGFGGIIEDTFSANNTSTATGGVVALAVTGGKLSLTGSNTYSGGTTVSTGTLLVNNASGSATGTGAVNVSGGGTIGGGTTAATAGATLSKLGGTGHVPTLSTYNSLVGKIGGALIIQSGGILAPGNSVGTITTASLTLQSGSIANYEFNGTANDFTIVSGNLEADGGGFNLYAEGTTNAFDTVGVYDLFKYSTLTGDVANFTVLNQQAGFSYTFVNDGADGLIQLDITTAAIPEPSTWALLIGGMAMLVIYQRRRTGSTLR